MRACIETEDDLRAFVRSQTAANLVDFLRELGECLVGGKRLAPEYLSHLDDIKELAMQVPPAPTRQRYGNIAFRDFVAKLRVEEDEEMQAYLSASFGNVTRIDYGTGHELNFVAFLFVHRRRHQMPAELYASSLCRYAELARFIIDRYQLEPAGSHGVWGLDDYQHVPFLLGAFQLIGNADQVTPRDALDARFELLSARYVYLQAIQHVRHCKRTAAPFSEHSPLLADIADLPDWRQAAEGLLRMWRGEVLGKKPVVQHFLFGPALPFPRQ